MTRLTWDSIGDRLFEVGVDRGVIYPIIGGAIAWSGLVSVKEMTSESDISTNYVDGQKYATRHTAGSFSATIGAYTYPGEFEEHRPFGLCYRTRVGNDVAGSEYGYKLHLVYNAQAAPSESDYASVNSSAEAIAFSWDISTKPIPIDGARPSAHLIVDSTKTYPWTMAAFEALLYGTEDSFPRMPSLQEAIELIDDNAILKITDHGDGTWTADGPDEVVKMLDGSTFQIDWPSVVYISSDEYTVSSL